jgi:hypothetical protein
MDGPGVIRPNRRINIPELGLQHLTAWIIKTAGVLAMVFGLTAYL